MNEPALNTLKEVAALPKRPSYIQYLLAKSLFDAGQPEPAWQALDPLLDEP